MIVQMVIIASLVIVVDQVLKAYAFSLAKQLSALRDQILNMANKKDSNGLPRFGGLGSAANPFVDTPTGVVYQGNSGQQGASAVAIPYTADGQSTWMDVPTGNGTFTVSRWGQTRELLDLDAVESFATLVGVTA